MIPKINVRGHSFKGVTAYLMHDKKASTAERVDWSDTGNMHTHDIEKAALLMAYIDKNSASLKREFGGSAAGRKSEVGNVYHYSLSWAPGENPTQEHQYSQALETLERLGLSAHQYYMVAHNDTEHKHLHIVANLINMDTGKVHTPSFDKRELQSWALEYEKSHIMHCHKREENALKREQGRAVKHQEQKQDYSEKITRAYYAADNGKSFIHALNEEGLELAKARRGNNFVIVDDKGDIQKLSRQLDIDERGKAKSAAIQTLLKDIDREKIQDADACAKAIKGDITENNKPYDRDAKEVQQQKDLADAAERVAKNKVKEPQNQEPEFIARPKLKHPPQRPYAETLDKIQANERKEDRQREQLENTLKSTYNRKQTEQNLKDLKSDSKNSNTLWGLLTGKHKADLENIDLQQKNLASIAQRETAMRHALEQNLVTEKRKVAEKSNQHIDIALTGIKYKSKETSKGNQNSFIQEQNSPKEPLFPITNKSFASELDNQQNRNLDIKKNIAAIRLEFEQVNLINDNKQEQEQENDLTIKRFER